MHLFRIIYSVYEKDLERKEEQMMEPTERNCHRLKAVFGEMAVKCIRELIWRAGEIPGSRIRELHTLRVSSGG